MKNTIYICKVKQNQILYMLDFIKENINAISLNTLLMMIVSVALVITIIIAIRKHLFKKSPIEKIIDNIPVFGDHICVGRSTELKIIREKILHEESLIICGPAGIGKSFLVYNSIFGIKRKLLKHYDRVLYYDFAINTDLQYALNELCNQIPNPESKEFRVLLNEKKYLIWLDGCELIKHLNDILTLSSNPVFVLCTRDNNQIPRLQYITDQSDSIIRLTGLSERKSIELLTNKRKSLFPFLDENKEINAKIVRFVGFHPYSIYIIKQNPLYQRDPQEFYDLLVQNSLLYKEKVNESGIYHFRSPETSHEIEYNLYLLIKEDLDFVLAKNDTILSVEARKALGLIGCMADDTIYSIFLFSDLEILKELTVFNVDVVKELKNSPLGKYFVFDEKSFKTTNSIVNKVFAEQSGFLLNNDYDCVFKFLSIMYLFHVYSDYNKNKSGKSQTEFALFKNRNHILSCVKNLLSNKEIKINENQIDILVHAILLLAEYGFFKEVVFLIDLFKKKYQVKEYNLDGLNLSLIISYEGLEELEKCMKLIPKLKESMLETKDSIVCYNNFVAILESLIHFEHFQYADDIYENYSSIVFQKLNDDADNNLKQSHLDIQLLHYEIKWNLKLNKNKEDRFSFIKDMTQLLTDMQRFYDSNDINVIEAKMLLAEANTPVNKRDAIYMYYDIISSIISRRFNPKAYEIINKIADFFSSSKNYIQAEELLKFNLFISEMIFGNEHILTNRIRGKREILNSLSSGKDNSNELLFALERKGEEIIFKPVSIY